MLTPTNELMVWANNLVEKYGKLAHETLMPCWNQHEGFEGYGFFESCFVYALMREVKPEVIFEISPACGTTTYPLALAVRDNHKGKVYSFELSKENCDQLDKNLRRVSLRDYVEIFQGDVMGTVDPVLKRVGVINVLFMDSDHQEPMGKWYMEKLWPLTLQWMHVHDFYYLINDGEILLINRFLLEHPEIKWLSTKHLFKPGFSLASRPGPMTYKDECHGEANSSIWIKKGEQ